jgi:Holliday junction DNA helicase RuvA
MRDKLGQLTLDSEITNDSVSQNGLFDDALSALVNLGYKKSQAEQALKKVCPEGKPEDSIEDLIKKSLNLLS